MGEAIISRGFSGANGGGSSGVNGNFITEIITSNTLWKVPENLKDGTVSVRIFGGGSSGTTVSGGGGGFMNNGIVNLYEYNDSMVYITIGDGGTRKNSDCSGGTTSFGSYLFALGADSAFGHYSASGGGYIGHGGVDGIQFGGGGTGMPTSDINYVTGGNGGKWGGGGGSCIEHSNNNSATVARGGCLYENSQDIRECTGYSGLAGNGGNGVIDAENGTNTVGMGLEFEGTGLAGISSNKAPYIGGGGGGYGGNGGNAHGENNRIGGGGGGGYGANGGHGAGKFNSGALSISKRITAGGGGGGYGGDGGNAEYVEAGVVLSNKAFITAGGGGGYGKYGKGGEFNTILNCITKAGIAAGGIGCGNSYINNSLLDGGPGICIIQYYIK